MSNLKKYIQKLQNNNVSFEEQEKALVEIEKTIKEAKQRKEDAVNKNTELIVNAFKKIEDKLNNKYQELLNTPALVGKEGLQGPAGKDGRQGKDGLPGRDGKDGKDGKDGIDGKDGVNIVDAKIDFDGSLVIILSDGNEIDAGRVVSDAVAKEFNSFMTRGEILPLQDGNAGKYLKTDGNALSWDTLDGSDIDLDSPPPIGNTTPNTGAFTTAQASNLRINQAWDEGTGRLQVMGQAAVEGNVVAQDLVVQGGNNLLQRSEEFNNAYWAKINTTVAANTTTAPDGTSTAETLLETAATAVHNFSISGGRIFSASDVYACSVYVKANGRDRVHFGIFGNSPFPYVAANFDLTAVTATAAALGTGSVRSTTITAVGNDWYRLTVVGTLGGGAGTGNFFIQSQDASGNNSYAGDITKGLFVWGAQLELGTVASPYTPTTSAAITTTNDIFVPSGQVLASAGTASLPAISNLNDTNTGMFFPAADTIAFAEGGAEAMRIDSSGRVGIGTSSPAYLLEIAKGVAQGVGPVLYLHNTIDAGTVGHAAEIRFNLRNTEATSRNAIIRAVASDGFGTNPNIVFLTSELSAGEPTERMRINAGGIVFIGNGETAASPSNALLQATGGSGTNITGATLTIQGGRGTGSAAGGPIVFSTSAAGSSGTTLNAATERMRILANGDVGIGTSSPSAKLHVVVNALNGFVVSDDTAITRYCSIGADSSGDAAYITAGSALTNNVPLVFRTASSGVEIERLRITSAGVLQIADAGNIAVGTSTGTKIGTATSQKIAFWNATPIVQPTTGVAAATVAATGLGDVVAASTTFDGYTIPQVVKALRNAGLLA